MHNSTANEVDKCTAVGLFLFSIKHSVTVRESDHCVVWFHRADGRGAWRVDNGAAPGGLMDRLAGGNNEEEEAEEAEEEEEDADAKDDNDGGEAERVAAV